MADSQAKEITWLNILLIIISGIISLFTILIIIIYLKSKYFKSYPCYFNIFFCLIITLDNLLRLIPHRHEENRDEHSYWCWIQAFSLSFCDKQFLTSITIYSIIHYLGVFQQDFYENNIKYIFITLITITVFISLLLTIIFILKGVNDINSEVCYVSGESDIKQSLDTIFTALLLLIDIFCLIRIITKMCKLSRAFKENEDKRKNKSILMHIWRFIFDLIINIITFGYILLIINKGLSFIDNKNKGYIDLIYIILCLITELFFTINSELYREFMRLLTCNKVEKFKKGKREGDKFIENEENDNDDEGNDAD